MASSPETRKTPGFLLVFRNSRIRDLQVIDCRYAMNPAGTMPAASPPGGPGGPGRRASGPTGRRGPRPAAAAAMPFSLSLPAPHRGGGGHNTSRERSDPPHCLIRAASPPGDRSGAERPGGRARRPPDPARTARPIASGTCCRHDAYSRRAGCWSGPAPEGTGAGIPQAVARPAGEVRPRQRAFVPAPTETMRGEVFTGARPRAATSDFFSGQGSPSITTRPTSARRRSSPSWSRSRCVSPAASSRAGPSGRTGSVGRASGRPGAGVRMQSRRGTPRAGRGALGRAGERRHRRGRGTPGPRARCPRNGGTMPRPSGRAVRVGRRCPGRPAGRRFTGRRGPTASASSAGRRPAGLARDGLEPPHRGDRRRAG